VIARRYRNRVKLGRMCVSLELSAEHIDLLVRNECDVKLALTQRLPSTFAGL
jgi:hypothetical protein